MTNIFTKTLAIAATTTKAPKGRPDVKHGCNPCAITPSAQHGCNPCAVTPARNGCNPRKTKTLLLALLLALLAPEAAWAQSRDCNGPITITADAPYTQGFESPEGTAYDAQGPLPDCWDGPGDFAPHNTVFANSHGGSQSLSFYQPTAYAVSYVRYALLPEFSNPLHQLQVSFHLSAEKQNFGVASGTIALGYITAEDNGFCNTFTAIETYEYTLSSWEQRTTMLWFVPTTAQRLVFRTQGQNTIFYVDDLEVSAMSIDCYPVSNLSVDNVTTTSATLDWELLDESQTEWDVQVATNADFTENLTHYVADIHENFALNNLSPSTRYYVRVRPSCSETLWSSTLDFLTSCEPITITADAPYFEDFQGYAASALPDCWEAYTTDATAPYVFEMISGPKYLRFTDNSFAILPEFSNPLSELQISFNKQNQMGQLQLGYLTAEDDGTCNTFTAIAIYGNSSSMEQRLTYLFNVPATAQRLAFKWIRNVNFPCDIDNVEVAVVPLGFCYPVEALSLGEVFHNAAYLSWGLVDESQTEWDVQVATNMDFTENVANYVADNHENFLIGGLSGNTQYFVRVKPTCSEDHWSNFMVFTTLCGYDITFETPYTEGFENPDGSFYESQGPLPACWGGRLIHLNEMNMGNPPHNVSDANAAHNGSQFLYFEQFGNNDYYAVLPEFSNPLSQLQISFWMKNDPHGNGQLSLGYLTDDDTGDCATFTEYATYNNTNTLTWVSRATVLEDMPPTAHRLVFKWHLSNSSKNCFIDDVEVSINPLAYNFGGGSGTETDPYLIATTDHMDVLAANVNNGNNYSGKFFRMVADLDYTGKTYTRIGTSAGQHFSGNFDGNGHTISHVTLNENENYLGLFGFSNGMVKNLTLDHSSIHAEQRGSVGGIVGCCSWGAVTGCYVTENVSISATGVDSGMGMTMGGVEVGGIVGTAYYCTVSNCMNFADVSGVKFVGGVAGVDNTSTITNNYYAGNCNVGGIGNHESNIGSDVEGQAQRGYAIEPQRPLGISLEGSIGLSYDGKVYAGENQEVLVGLEISNFSITPQCYLLSAGTLDDNGDGTFTITMPAEDITVSSNIVEQDGLYYELPCNGDNTATLIRDDSYPMLQGVYIDESITVTGTDYFVTAIADYAFDGCDSIQSFDCHPQLISIGDYAFRNCTSLEYLGFYNGHTPPTVGTGCFDGLGLDTLMLMVPFCSQYDYAIHPVWGQFGTLFPDGNCEYNFIGMGGDRLWSNPDNWAGGEVPGEGAQVGIMNDCEVDTDVTAGSITIGSNCLTVKDGATLTASNFIYTAGDERSFVIEDGAQVIHNNAGAKATIEKTITAYTPNTKNGWHLIGFSFAENDTVAAMPNLMANSYDLYYYDEPTHYWMNHKYTDNGFTEMEPAKGYLYANSADVTIGLKGTLEAGNATVNVPLDYTEEAGTLKGFNLVGNPFAHNVTTFTGNNVATDCYRMNDTKDDLMVSAISTTKPLLPGEGFFVKATGDNASVTFNGQTRGENATTGRIALELRENGKLIDRFVVKRDGEPLEKLTLKENGTKIYATEDAQDYAVVVIVRDGVHTVSTADVPVNFKAAKNGTYTISFNLEGIELDYLHLIDNLTGADIDLLSPSLRAQRSNPGDQGDYTFTAKTTDYASRFRLVFSANDDAEGDNVDAPFAYIDASGNIIITGDAGTASLQIVDVMGRVIRTVGLSHCGCRTTTTGMTPGVYVLRLIDGENVRTQKIVVQ